MVRPSPNINKVHIDPYSQLFSPDLGAVHFKGKEMWLIKKMTLKKEGE